MTAIKLTLIFGNRGTSTPGGRRAHVFPFRHEITPLHEEVNAHWGEFAVDIDFYSRLSGHEADHVTITVVNIVSKILGVDERVGIAQFTENKRRLWMEASKKSLAFLFLLTQSRNISSKN